MASKAARQNNGGQARHSATPPLRHKDGGQERRRGRSHFRIMRDFPGFWIVCKYGVI